MNDFAKQHSGQWFYDRCGATTASRFRDVVDTLKNGKPGAKRETYMWEIVIERLTGQPSDHFASTAMQHGTDTEPLARMAYESRTGRIVEEVGFIKHPTIPLCGGSPDGTIDDDGMIEIKCPWNSRYHLQTCIGGMPEEHMAQVQGLLWITKREWCDFVSYDFRMPEELKLYCQRIERNDEYIVNLEKEIIAFSAEVDAIVKKLTP